MGMILNIMSASGPLSLLFSIFTTRVKSRKLVFMLYAFSTGLLNVGFAVSDQLNLAWAAGIFAIGINIAFGLLGIPTLVIYAIEIGSNSMLAISSVW